MANASGLVDPHGRPIRSSQFAKAKPPSTGQNAQWGGKSPVVLDQLMGGSAFIQFDLNQLQLSDYRAMRSHPSVNTSLGVLSFMQHQSKWEISHPNKKVRDFLTEQLTNIWTALNRSMSQANWAGYSPCALEWLNDVDNKQVIIKDVHDLVPENCSVNWKKIKGQPVGPNHIRPTYEVYDGIKQLGQPEPIAVPKTFWYPLMMENGDYYGRKLLQSAFTPWYFSQLVHVYANRYYERFGEPQAIGRAPFDDAAPAGTSFTNGSEFMAQTLKDLRNHSVTVLPNEGHQDSGGKYLFDYDITFLESQMRGADFERYLTRLDEEISLSLFTPVLLMRVADVGSYNLGQGHMQVYLWMMNAMNADRAYYIEKYILRPLIDYNFSTKMEGAKLVYRKLGDTDQELVKDILTSLVNSKSVMPDLVELGKLAGMSLKEIEQTAPEVVVETDGQNPPNTKTDDKTDDKVKPKNEKVTVKASKNEFESLVNAVCNRVYPQIEKAYRVNSWDRIQIGFERGVATALGAHGVKEPQRQARVLLGVLDEACFGSGLGELPGMEKEAGLSRFREMLGELLESAVAEQEAL